jgi:hypothetical protein
LCVFCVLECELSKMGLLDKLWDDVVAGPQPDQGLKKLRKERLAAGLSDVFQDESDDFAMRMMNRRRSAEFQHSQAEARRVTQSISIKKPPMLRPLDTDSPANSPGSYGSSPPASPSLASPSPSMFREKDRRWRSVFHPDGREMSRSCSAQFEHVPAPNSPTVYDWVVISALDR